MVYTKIYIQILLFVRDSSKGIQAEWQAEFFEHLQQIAENADINVLSVAGTADHVHLFLEWANPECSLDALVEILKGESSKYLSAQKWRKTKAFWTDEYAAFSYGRSQIEAVLKYLSNQTEYHARHSLREEVLNFFNKFEVDYSEEDLTWLPSSEG